MRSGYRSSWVARLGLVAAVALTAGYLMAADRPGKALGRGQPAFETVEMFQAIEDGRIDVKVIPKDSKRANVLIENKTNKPLTVQLPDAFAGVPVLAQFGAGAGGLGAGAGLGAGGNFGGGLGGGLGGGQGFGGGFGGGLGGLGGFGGGGFGGGGLGGGGFFNIPPEKVGKLQVTTVCLEHGKPEPRPAMKYRIRPIAEFTDKEEVHELCRMLGSGIIDQRAAQVAAWHLNNNMSWQQLIAKKLKFANGLTRPYFSPAEIRRGMQAASMAAQIAAQRREAAPEESLSQR